MFADASSSTPPGFGSRGCRLPVDRMPGWHSRRLRGSVTIPCAGQPAGDLRDVRVPLPHSAGPLHATGGEAVRSWAPGGALVSNVEVTAATVLRGDIIQVGGQACRVSDLFQLPQGAKQLLFESGELLTINGRTRLAAVRMTRRR